MPMNFEERARELYFGEVLTSGECLEVEFVAVTCPGTGNSVMVTKAAIARFAAALESAYREGAREGAREQMERDAAIAMSHDDDYRHCRRIADEIRHQFEAKEKP